MMFVSPEALISDFGSRLKVLLESVRPYIDPSEYQEVLNQTADFLTTVVIAVLASHDYEIVGIGADTDRISVTVRTSDPQ